MCELLPSRGGNRSMKVIFNNPSRPLMVADLSRTETRVELVKTATIAPEWDITLISQKCSVRQLQGIQRKTFRTVVCDNEKHWAEYVSSGLNQQKAWTHHRMHPHTGNFQDKKHRLFWQLLLCDTYLEFTMSHVHTKKRWIVMIPDMKCQLIFQRMKCLPKLAFQCTGGDKIKISICINFNLS